MSAFWLVSVAEHVSLILKQSEIPKTGFLSTSDPVIHFGSESRRGQIVTTLSVGVLSGNKSANRELDLFSGCYVENIRY